MAWIRLDDDYIYHPKFALLSDRAFRLWHEGMCYCRKLMTDGLIRVNELKAFRYFTPKCVSELTTTRGQAEPLWVPDPEGYRVHDYLDWNPSQAEEQADREATKLRVRAYRSKWRAPPDAVGNALGNASGNGVRNAHGNALVRGWGQGEGSSSEKGSGEKPHGRARPLDVTPDVEALELRAGHLLERYAELFYLHRKGARYHNRMHLDFEKAQQLVQTWADDARLEKLAVLILTTDDEWISGTDRGFGVFAAKASWADDRLADWEAKQEPN